MNLTHLLFFWLGISALVFSCKSVQQSVSVEEDAPKEHQPAPAVTVEKEASSVEQPVYRAEETKRFDLIHTKLEVSFDWEKRYLYGKAMLQLKPYFYPQEVLELDAKGFDIHQVLLVDGDSEKEAAYEYDGEILKIDLGKLVSKNEVVTLEIGYTAKPYEREAGGSAAITSDRGLYFINHDGSEEGKPRQIWTQGETEASSCWFPTIDAPNQKSTQEIYITVDENLETLSNGDLIYSQINGDGTKTDYWKMDKPHAPYLFMMAIGEYAIVEDEWQGLPVQYYVEPEFKDYAKDIFGDTPEMLTYFSELLNYPYPWTKYSQVVVRDYVSGAMENTTASVFMEDLQMTKRELLDENFDYIIAHELFHHWFGDLVTCESWSNLTLNEGFANYSEFLWETYKNGEAAGQYKLYEELNAYLGEAQSKKVDLVRFHYEDKEDMFDNHSYAKGGLVLHMLRDYVGDDAFFKSLNHYLNENKYQDVEVHNLRLAFETVTGEDLNWFFNQWFLDNGHPQLEVSHTYNDSTGILSVKVRQKQDFSEYPVYRIPVDVALWVDGAKQEDEIWIDKPLNEFEFEVAQKPDLFLFNSEEDIVAEVEHIKTTDELIFQSQHADNIVAKLKAYEALATDSAAKIAEVFHKGLSDTFPEIQRISIAYAQQAGDSLVMNWEEEIVELTKKNNDNGVRSDAIFTLSEFFGDKYHQLYHKASEDSSYVVAGSGLYAALQSAGEGKDELVARFIGEENANVVLPLANYFITSQDTTKLDWFIHQTEAGDAETKYYMLRMLGQYMMISGAEGSALTKGLNFLYDYARNDPRYFLRIAAVQSLQLFEGNDIAGKKLQELKSLEKDERVIRFLN